MQITPNTTKIFVTAWFIVSGLYDLVAIEYGAPGASISQFLEGWEKHPYCMVCVGVLVCHFWGYTMKPAPEQKTIGIE